MASLSGKHRTGTTVWDFYISGLKGNLKTQIEFDTTMYLFEKSSLIEFKPLFHATPIEIISKELLHHQDRRFALCKTEDNSIGYVPITRLRKPTEFLPKLAETKARRMLDDLIKSEGEIPIFVFDLENNLRFCADKCIGARSVEGFIRADITIYSQAKDEIFISHKASGKGAAFQQYCGISEKNKTIFHHDETQEFIYQVTNYIEDKRLKHPIMMRIEDLKLMSQAIFGGLPDQPFNENNVHMVAQGIPKLLKESNGYRLEWSEGHTINGELSKFISCYLPVFGATYRLGRGFSIEGSRYYGARLGIYPQRFLTKRTNLLILR